MVNGWLPAWLARCCKNTTPVRSCISADGAALFCREAAIMAPLLIPLNKSLKNDGFGVVAVRAGELRQLVRFRCVTIAGCAAAWQIERSSRT